MGDEERGGGGAEGEGGRFCGGIHGGIVGEEVVVVTTTRRLASPPGRGPGPWWARAIVIITGHPLFSTEDPRVCVTRIGRPGRDSGERSGSLATGVLGGRGPLLSLSEGESELGGRGSGRPGARSLCTSATLRALSLRLVPVHRQTDSSYLNSLSYLTRVVLYFKVPGKLIHGLFYLVTSYLPVSLK